MTSRHSGPEPLPQWVNIIVVLAATGALLANIWKYGADGYPNTFVLAGLVGAYSGVNGYLRNKSRNGNGNSSADTKDGP